jgi:hypothetical protein
MTAKRKSTPVITNVRCYGMVKMFKCIGIEAVTGRSAAADQPATSDLEV